MSRRFIPPALPVDSDTSRAERDHAVAEAHRAGFAEGHAAGMAEGLKRGEAAGRAASQPEIERLRALATGEAARSTVLQALTDLTDRHVTDIQAIDRACREALNAALQTLFPVLLDSAIGAEIAALAAETLQARAPEKLVLRAAPSTLAAILAEDLADTGDDRLTLVPDESLEPGAATLSWFGGGLTFNPADLLRRVEAILAPPPLITTETKDSAP